MVSFNSSQHHDSGFLKQSSDALTSDDIREIISFVQSRGNQCIKNLTTLKRKGQVHRSTLAFIQNVLDFVLKRLPPNQEMATFLSTWLAEFFALMAKPAPKPDGNSNQPQSHSFLLDDCEEPQSLLEQTDRRLLASAFSEEPRGNDILESLNINVMYQGEQLQKQKAAFVDLEATCKAILSSVNGDTIKMPHDAEINRNQIERLFELLKVVDFRRIESDLDSLSRQMQSLSDKMATSLQTMAETNTDQNQALLEAIDRQSKNIEKLLGGGKQLIDEFSPRGVELPAPDSFEQLETRQPQEEHKGLCDYSEGEIQVEDRDDVSSVQQPSVQDQTVDDSLLQSAFEEQPPEYQGSLKKASQAVNRHITSQPEPYFIGWQSSYMQLVTKDLLFVKNKQNQIDVLNANTFQICATFDTSDKGVFCSLQDPSTDKIYVGCYDGHLLAIKNEKTIHQTTTDITNPNHTCGQKMLQVDTTISSKLGAAAHMKLKSGIYDMVLMPDQQTLMTVQHFGYIEFVDCRTHTVQPGGVHLSSTNSIYCVAQTSRKILVNNQQDLEYVIGSLRGLRFLHLKKLNAKIGNSPYDISLLKEIYFKDESIQRVLEYEPNKFAVCIFKSDSVHLLDRDKKSSRKICVGGKSCCWELALMPGYNLKSLPWLLVRDDLHVKAICVKGDNRVIQIVDAPYKSQQNYKSMSIQARSRTDFSILLLVHKDDQTSRVTVHKCDSAFIQSLRTITSGK